MSSQARTVLWIGLFLIVMQLVAEWKYIRGVIFSGSPVSGGGSNSPGSIPPNSIYNVPGVGPLLHWFTHPTFGLLVHQTPSHIRAG